MFDCVRSWKNTIGRNSSLEQMDLFGCFPNGNDQLKHVISSIFDYIFSSLKRRKTLEERDN